MEQMLIEALSSALETLQSMLAGIIAFAPRLLLGLTVGVVSYFVARRLRRWSQHIAERTQAPEQVEQLIIKAVYLIALLLGATLTLSVLGVNVYGMVAGLGISGLVVGFALKDIIENLLAGVLLLLQQPFELGDVIEVAGVRGTVTHIELRATTLDTLDRLRVVIPNRAVYTSVITNYSTHPVRRREVNVGVGYGEDLPRAIQIMLETVRGVEGVTPEPESFVTLNDFGDSAVLGTLYYYIDTDAYSYADTHTAVVTALQQAADRHKIDLPYPTSVVITREG